LPSAASSAARLISARTVASFSTLRNITWLTVCARRQRAFLCDVQLDYRRPGEAHYKNLFCSDAEPLFDGFLPLSPAGRLLAPAAAIAEAGKRAIKQRAALWSMVQGLRRLRARFSA
jgi:hypothetical protein